MPVAQNDRYIRYAPAPLSTVMPYDFQIFDQTVDIGVVRLRAGAISTLVLTTDYTVSGVGVLSGGNITLVAPSVAGDVYAIYGIGEYRASDYTQAGDFLASTVNIDFNKQMQVSQQLRRDVDRSIRLSPVDDTANLVLPVKASRLDKFLKFHAVTGDIEVSEGTTEVDGTADEIDVTDGVIVGIADNPIIPGVARMKIPVGTTAQRSAGSVGDLRYNTDTTDVEAFVGASWQSLLNAGTGAPISSTYIVQTPDGVLSNEQALSALATGIMRSTTGTGVVSIAIEGTHYYAPGGTNVAIADGGTNADTAAGARTNLGLAIGTDVQAFDATLLSLAALGTAADRMAYTTGVDTWAETPITAAGRALIDDASAADQRTTLGLVIGTNVQAFDATLLSIAALGTAANKMIYTTGIDTWAEADITAAGRAILDDATAGDQRTTLGLVIGTDVQAFDATLLSIAALGTAADRMAYTTGVDTWAETPITAAGRALIDDASASDQRTTLGLVIGTNVQAFDATLLSLAALGTAADRMAYTTGVDTWAETPITAAGRALIDDATAGDQRTTLGLGTIATQNANAVAITGGTFSGITQGDVDNLRLDGNTISSTNANGNVTVDPNGTGQLEVVSTAILLDEIATPATPAANKVNLYAKSDGHLYQLDDAGTETDLTAGAGGLPAATQAEMEAGASTTVASTPARQQYHQSSLKLWCEFTTVTTTAITVSYNVASLTDGGTGLTTVNFTTAMSGNDYPFVMGQGRGAISAASFDYEVNDDSVTPTTTAIKIRSLNSSGTNVDRARNCIMLAGDQ